MTAEYVSDILDRVTNITYRAASGAVVRSFAYSYDATDMITRQVSVTDGESVTNSYAYDGLDRLIAVKAGKFKITV